MSHDNDSISPTSAWSLLAPLQNRVHTNFVVLSQDTSPEVLVWNRAEDKRSSETTRHSVQLGFKCVLNPGLVEVQCESYSPGLRLTLS